MSVIRNGWAAPIALVGVAAAVLAFLASRIRDWGVMTDELQYAKLATHIGRTLSPLPTMRGMHVSTCLLYTSDAADE